MITYRDGVMAGDSALSSDGVRTGRIKKVYRLKDGRLYGATGLGSEIEAVRRWLEAGQPQDDQSKPILSEGFAALHVSAKDLVREFDRFLNSATVKADFYAIGWGHQVALGAMAHGATAQEAIEICLDLVDGCGGPVEIEKL